MKVLNRMKKEITADENPRAKFERNVNDFLRAAQNKGVLEVNGPLSTPRYKEINEDFGSFTAMISIKAMLIDYETIRNLRMYSGRFDIEVVAIQWMENRWACLTLKSA